MAKKQEGGGLSALLEKYSAEKEDELLPTGIMTVDDLIGGGIARGAMYAIWGPQGSGKSTIAIQIMKSFLRRGERCAFIDVEKAFTRAQQECYGVRKYVEEGLLLHLKADTYAQADELTTAIAKDKDMDVKFVLVDSESMLLPKLADDQAVDDNMPGQKARQASLWLTKCKGQMYDSGITFVFLSHARANIDMSAGPYAPKDRMAGGRAAMHAPDCIIQIQPGQKLGADKAAPEGQIVHLTTDKNKFAKPFQKVDAKLYFGVGIKKSVDLIDRAIEKGIITQSGAYFTFGDKSIRGTEALYQMSNEDLKSLQQKIAELK